MKKRELLNQSEVTKEAILAKIQELSDMVAVYFVKFEKTTDGTQSVGDVSIKFVEKCSENIPLYPEILAATFKQADALVKMGGVFDFFVFKKLVMAMLLEWEKAAKICKSDAMSYSNEYYGILKKAGSKEVKYRPALDELTPFFKRSASSDGGTPPPPTT